MNLAILGAGMVADYHKTAIEACAGLGARLAAVGHYDPARFDAISERFGVPCRSLEDLLADPAIDAVSICTPSGQHADQAVAAARAGKHVFVEKPMALSLADADRMIDACERAGVKLGVVFQRRSEPVFRHIHRAVTGGDFGELTLGVVTMPYLRNQAYYDQAAWRGTWALDGGGVLMNQGIHLVDLLVWLMGDPVEIRAHAGTLHRRIEVEDTLAAALRFASGALATITATTTAGQGFPHRIELFGTNGGVQLEGESVTRWQVVDPARATVEPPQLGAADSAGSGGDPRGIQATAHVTVLRDFLEAVRDDRAPAIDGREGRRSLRAVLGIYEAAGLLPRA